MRRYASPRSGKSAFASSSGCSVCGEEFQKPLRATVASGSKVSDYYACPRCLSEVGAEELEESAEDQKSHNEVLLTEEKMQELSLNAAEQNKEGRFEVRADCEHELGYLKKRPKNTPIPDHCLICLNMIECMTR